MPLLEPPDAPIRLGPLTLRMPHVADAAALAAHCSTRENLAGIWLETPLGTPVDECERHLAAWRDAWREEAVDPSRMQRLLVNDAETEFVGHVTLVRHPTLIELSYGIAPAFRSRGYATTATRAVTDWLHEHRAVQTVELRIDHRHKASQRVAQKAGYHFVEEFQTYIPGTGKTATDHRYWHESI